MKTKISVKTILGWGAVALLLSLIAATNYITVFTTDDLWYGTNLVTGKPLAGISDIIESQIWHYFNWGGRAVAHTILQFTLLGGRVIADLCNVIMTIGLMALVCWYCEKISYKICLFVLGGIVVFNPSWWDNMMWQSGSVNYLYMTNFILLYIICFVNVLKKGYGKTTNIFLCILMVPLGLFAGCSNENMGPAAFLAGAAVMILLYVKKAKTNIWMWIGEVTCAVGCGVMLLSPGNSVRNAEIVKQPAASMGEAIKNLFFQKYVSIGKPLFIVMISVVIALFISIVALKALKIDLELKDKILLGTALISYLAMWVSPHYPGRATYGTIILIMCVIARIGTRIGNVRTDLRKYLLWVVIAIDCGMAYNLALYIFQMKKWIN